MRVWKWANRLGALVAVALLLGTPAEGEGKESRRVVEAHGHLSLSGVPLILQVMEEHGIEWMVNLSGGSPGRGMQRAVELAKRAGGRVINFYTPDWSRFGEPDFGVVEARRLEMAVKTYQYGGLKISKHLGLGLRDPVGTFVDVDDPALNPLWEKAGELGVPVAIHVGDPKAFFEPLTPTNERWDELHVHPSWSFHHERYPRRDKLLEARNRVMDRHPRTTFICVHFGNNPEDPDAVAKWLDRYPNMLIDISARVGEFGRHPSEKMRDFFIRYQDRILFGTDIALSARGIMLGSVGEKPSKVADIRPFYQAHWSYLETRKEKMAHPVPIQGKWTVDGIGLPAEVLEKIYRKNAEKWIPHGSVPRK